MADRKLHHDPQADRLWRQCSKDADLRWLLEGVLSSRKPELGRTLLLSPVEIFGEGHARLGRKLSILFQLTGFPYLSGPIKKLSQSLQRMVAAQCAEPRQSQDAKAALAEWASANGRQAQDLMAAAVLETVRRNPVFRDLVTSDEPVTKVRVGQRVRDYTTLDWQGIEDMTQLFEPFLLRSGSKKLINRFTLNFTALLRQFRPEVAQQDVIFNSAQHFVELLKVRRVSEDAWRELLFSMIDRELMSPYTAMYLWCRRFPEEGFVASASLALGSLPPFCPSCAEEAHAMACFAPARGLDRAMRLKDGLLGAAVGWHLKKRGIRFWHSVSVEGTEMDFIPILPNGHLLIECKILSVLVSPRQLARTLREAITQLREHRALLERNGWPLNAAITLVNLSDDQLRSLRSERSIGDISDDIVSYERLGDLLKPERRAR